LALQYFCLILHFVRTKIIAIISAGHEISPTLSELEETRKKAWVEVKAKDFIIWIAFYFSHQLHRFSRIISSSTFISIKLFRMNATGFCGFVVIIPLYTILVSLF